MLDRVTHSIKRIGSYVFGILLLTSCGNFLKFGVDVYEIVHIHENGSGEFEIAVDLRKAEKFIDIAEYLAKEDPKFAQLAVHRAFRKTAKRLRRVPGIQKISTARDAKMLHFKLSFHFANIKALNRAMRKIYTHVDAPQLSYFKMNRKAFIRLDTRSIANLIKYYYEKDDSRIRSFDIEAFFKDITYTLIYKFDRKIKRATNRLAQVSRDRKMVVLKQHLLDDEERELSFSNKVIFKNTDRQRHHQSTHKHGRKARST